MKAFFKSVFVFMITLVFLVGCAANKPETDLDAETESAAAGEDIDNLFGISENDGLLDEDIVIVIKLKYGESLSHQDFFAYLKKNLAFFMVPRYIEFRKTLPKTALGRIKRSVLKDDWNKKNDVKNIWDSQKYLEKSK